MMHQGLINIIGWILVVSATVAFATATIGVAYGVSQGEKKSFSEPRFELHDTYYVVRSSRAGVWPFLLCIALSSAIGIIGYMHTDRYAMRFLEPRAEHGR